jgi:hypothetical protein
MYQFPPPITDRKIRLTLVGCLHHTGNLQLAINQCHRLLKPGGN